MTSITRDRLFDATYSAGFMSASLFSKYRPLAIAEKELPAAAPQNGVSFGMASPEVGTFHVKAGKTDLVIDACGELVMRFRYSPESTTSEPLLTQARFLVGTAKEEFVAGMEKRMAEKAKKYCDTHNLTYTPLAGEDLVTGNRTWNGGLEIANKQEVVAKLFWMNAVPTNAGASPGDRRVYAQVLSQGADSEKAREITRNLYMASTESIG